MTRILAVLMMMFGAASLAACDTNETPAEEVSEDLEEAADEAGDELEEAGDELEDEVE